MNYEKYYLISSIRMSKKVPFIQETRFLISNKFPLTEIYFPTQKSIRMEKIRQININAIIIHPFSSFS